MINSKAPDEIVIPSLEGYIVTYSLFNELQSNIIPNERLQQAYEEYKKKFENKRYNQFFQEHENDEWFKEKYDPEINKKYKNEIKSNSYKSSQSFFELYKNIESDIKLELKAEDEYNKNIKIVVYSYNHEKKEFEEIERDLSEMSNKITEKTMNIIDKPFYGFDPDYLTLFIHQIPKNISRWQILDEAKKTPGFVSCSLSEPIKSQNYARFCWITFENEEKCDLAYDILRNCNIGYEYKMHPSFSKTSTIKKIRVTPPLFDDRLNLDLELSKNIIELLDNEKSIVNNILLQNTENRNNEIQLDLQILYLRRVHGFCYYCIQEYEDERNLSIKCDNIHLRNYKKLGMKSNIENKEALKNEIEFDSIFTQKINDYIESLIQRKSKNETIQNSENENELEILRNNFCKSKIFKINNERFKCDICEKLFKGESFVINHIFNRHMPFVIENVDKKFYDKIKKDNYLNDPNKPFDNDKVINNMADYLSTLSNNKKFSYEDKNRHFSKNFYNYKDSRRDYRDKKKRKYSADFNDFDDPNKSKNINVQSITFDDL